MSPALVFLSLAVLLGASAGTLVFLRSADRPLEIRVLCSLAPVALLVTLCLVIGFLIALPTHDYSAARMAQSTGMIHGYVLYPKEGTGPILSTIYGPVSVLLYLPAALIDDMTASMTAAGATSVLTMLLPLAFLFLRDAEGERGPALAFFAFTTAALMSSEAMQQIFGSIHVDGPAVGLGVLSCAFLLQGARERRAPSSSAMSLAAACAVLAAWTKQVEAPIVFGQLGWLALAHGRDVVVRYFVSLAVFGLVISATFVTVFGFEEVVFNMLTIPGSHEFYPFGPILWEAARMALPFLIVLAWVALSSNSRRPLAEDWGLPALVFLALLPTSILARAKLGGFLNSYHSQFFLIAAAGFALRHWIVLGRPTAAHRRIALAACVLATAFLPYGRGTRTYRFLSEKGMHLEALEIAREHPDAVYFPWNPLVTLHADGRLYHFEWAVRDLERAGIPPSDAHIRAHLPEQLRYVVYPRTKIERGLDGDGGPKPALLEYLPEFDRRVEFSEWPNWIAFERSN